uniref:Fibrinogen-like 2a n=1 Tax=Myripristis murdjan TaxID=586833 RepID=A0A667XE51_9TELE
MRTTVLCVCASLLLSATVIPRTSQVADFTFNPHQRWDTKGPNTLGSESGTPASCPMKLRPSGQCGGSGAGAEEGEDCPYQLTLPPLTIQLPKQFRLLEKTMKELQNLKETVNKLKSGCMECRGGRGTGQQQADQGQPVNSLAQIHQGKFLIKLNKMSASLRNARNQISALQGHLERLNLLNIDNIHAIVDSKVENISTVINKISSTCNTQCQLQPTAQSPRDCSDYNALEGRKNGVYRVTPDPRNGTFEVFCDMESFGGGWTVIQQRLNGSISFNRTWAEYKKGFGNLRGEFWLGNDHIHLLTKAKDMILRIELEDFEGVREYAKYDHFYVANEFLRYRLSVSGYSGTAGNAISFSKQFNHDQKFFTTPDRDNDMYPSGNCGAYYSSGWWFDACMSANLNGKYYHKRYKGVRNGIFWGTWHNMSTEYYPTNYRQAFKTVKMMIRPKNYAP